MIELELDFAEEDVEFANRDQLKELVKNIQTTLKRLIDSFSTGNVIKNGVIEKDGFLSYDPHQGTLRHPRLLGGRTFQDGVE